MQAFSQLWTGFQNLIYQALLYLEHLTGDWGIAIILLTIAIRVLILPLTVKQTKSMAEMQRIQPKIKELQAKYKDDKEKLQEETLKFYSENKVNPFGGCLPLLLQMPIFFALFAVLRSLPTRTDDVLSFMAIIPNLAVAPKAVYAQQGLGAAIPYAILVILFAVSIWLPQALMPGDKQQKMIGAYMAIVMLWFGWTSPAGVLLYWDVSSIWGVAQQQLTMMSMKKTLDEGESGNSTTKSSSKSTAAAADLADKKPANKKKSSKKA